ncbi:MAG: helix-turn-helix domain-containing protein [Bacteroidota bacterium]
MKNPKKPNRNKPGLPPTQLPGRPMENDWLDNVDLLKIFHLSPRTLLRWRKDGLVHSKIGRKIFYSTKSVEAFLNRYSHGGTPEQA